MHFLCSFCMGSCEVCCAIFCDQIIREVVFFLGVLLLMKLWSVPNIKSIRCFYFLLGLLLRKNKMIREVVLLKPTRCGFVVFFLVVSCAVCCANF